MAPLTTTRTLFELRVGSTHTIEVLLQIRLSDISWWNSDLYNHERQLYKLIGRRVMPTECREEIEKDRAKIRCAANIVKKKKGAVVIGEANLKKKSEKEKSTDKKRGGKKAKSKETKPSKKQKICDKYDASDPREKKLKILREPGKWIMGKSIQICYMMEDIEKSTATTLIFRNKENTEDSNTVRSQRSMEKQTQSPKKGHDEEKMVPLSTFRSWKKLSKLVNLWVFKFDPDDPSDLSVSEGGGFPRPELLPMADIFRSAGGAE
mmetsp:Transcript_2777/g.5895  ORF Transcript_2777/g.5895 Transcript_2777/m.5895 type:complete len:264 (-) Transcript_2777:101-892(-)|eukprot:CAMPEP_0172536162 /NCGR_PEP_ID=MMETSP1067-20121228/7972_1 /TAXON_ID=265564 ORGANISM="Thalassiosira punctigera, Strain Tpunct2005C2" /NCGR_SAMPLE_ID=MMETSP1067 /ASSEMBLY_ACC=CAM_ASM_000444 /LENGTH=263 /DNA_ID=CAMNT_0013321187 /DNA_START=252 /DNA_END=1043 /DNA_ORIENTATION=-